MSKNLFSFIVLLTTSLLVRAEDCLKKQGAIDIGSGSTKSVVAVVDICKKIISEVISEENMAVPFAEILEKAADARVPEAFLKEQLPRYRELAGRMRRQGAVQIYAFGTAVFRKAANGSDVIRRIAENTGGPVEIITQEAEARLGYWSALAKRPLKKNENVIVWDIGGGSMQMIRRDGDDFTVYRGDLASVNFKNRVLREIQKKDPKRDGSPNPLGEDWKKAVALARVHARANVAAEIRKQAPGLTWIGIGGVLYNSVREQIGAESVYAVTDLRQTLGRKSKMTDTEIGGEYAATDVTNLALVAGYMEGLKIKKVEAVRASLAQGWLLYRLEPQPD